MVRQEMVGILVELWSKLFRIACVSLLDVAQSYLPWMYSAFAFSRIAFRGLRWFLNSSWSMEHSVRHHLLSSFLQSVLTRLTFYVYQGVLVLSVIVM